MNFSCQFEFFVKKILPIIVFALGTIGNIFGLIILSKRRLKKIGPRNMYRYLFIFGLIHSTGLINLYIMNYGVYLPLLSIYSCRGIAYFFVIIAPLSPMILLYISVEKFVSIKYPEKRLILRKQRNQLFYLICLVIYNLLINSWIPLKYEIINKRNSTVRYLNYNPKNNFECVLTEKSPIYLFFINAKVIPYTLLITFTLLIIHTIYKSRSKVILNYSYRQNLTFRKDLKFALTSLLFNFIFILFNLSSTIMYTLAHSSAIVSISFYLLYLLSFSLNFYLILISNSLFRKEFFSLRIFKK